MRSRRLMTTEVQHQRTHDPPAHRTFDDEQDDHPVDMAHLRKLDIPTTQDYPSFPPSLFNHKDRASQLHNLCHRSKTYYEADTVEMGKGHFFRTKVVIGLPNGEKLEATGEGPGKVR